MYIKFISVGYSKFIFVVSLFVFCFLEYNLFELREKMSVLMKSVLMEEIINE